MSISFNKLLDQMELEVQRAKQTNKKNEQRERLAAIKSLCELALSSDNEENVGRTTTMNTQPSFATSAPIQTAPLTTMQNKPLEENDANGDSLFDF